MMADTVEVLAEHYQKTFEVTLNLWEQRNRAFLIILLVVGAATLLTINPTKLVAEPLLVEYIAELFGVEPGEREALREGFPYGLIQSILLMGILFFMVLLFHRTTMIQRNYVYLADIEKEIRERLGLRDHERSFTREGEFYASHPAPFARQIGLAYIAMLGVLLIPFLAVRILTDISTGAYWIATVDAVLAAPTLAFFLAYCYLSSGLIRRLVHGLRKRLRRKARDEAEP